MSALLYYITVPFIYLISFLPFRILYILSDVTYILLYKLIGYRKKIVLANLRNSFPEKSEEEINRICKAFYHYFCDLVLETFKTLTISPAVVSRHIIFEDSGIIEKFKRENKSIIIVTGHMGNWEMGCAYSD